MVVVMKKTGKFKKSIFVIFSILLYVVAGVVLARFLIIPDGVNFFEYLFAFFITVYVSNFVQVILHEAGHMVCGLISGYRFLFFRIYSLMLVKHEGKLHLKKLGIAGTAGQCIMLPPSNTPYEKVPFLLYNLGGVLANLISSALFIILYFTVRLPLQFNVVFPCLAIMGIASAILNGIPMPGSTVANDGYNILSMIKNSHSRRAFVLQLEMNGMLALGKRVSEMPAEWFTLPDADKMNDPLSTFVAAACVDRLMDEKRFDEALKAIEYISENSCGISGLSKGMIICNRMYCEMMNGATRDVIDAMRTKEQLAIMKQMKNFPVVIRTEYVYSMLCKHDRAGAIEKMMHFDKIAKTYPYPADIACERELMLLADEKYYETIGAANVKK